MSIYQNNTSIFTPGACELKNHGFVIIFAMPHVFLCGAGLKSNRKQLVTIIASMTVLHS